MIEKFTIKGKQYEAFFAEDGQVEIYEEKNPKNGFIFEDIKRFILFVNCCTDILDEVGKNNA